MLIFGLFLLAADRLGVTVSRVEHMGYGAAFTIGILQAAALIPGVSRTGITITAARLLGYERAEAARFSLLIAIPLVGASMGFGLVTLSRKAELILSSDLLIATGLAMLGALVAIALMIAWVRNNTFAPFAIWRMVVGAGALGLLLI